MNKIFIPLLIIFLGANLATAREVDPRVNRALEAAEAAVATGNYDAALSGLRDALLQNPSEPYLLYNYGLTAYLAGNLTIARDAWGRLENLEGEDGQLGRNLGSLSLFQLGNTDMREGLDLEAARNATDALILYRRAADFYRIAVSMGGKASQKAKANLEKALASLSAMAIEIGGNQLKQAERMLQDADQKVEEGNWRHFDRIESSIREAADHFREALAINDKNEEARAGLEKAEDLLDDALLAEARASRENLQDREEKDGFRNTEQKVDSYAKVLEKYDDVLAVNDENQQALDERGELAKNIAADLLAEANRDRDEAREFHENDQLRKTIDKMEEAQEKLSSAASFDPDNTEIAETLERNELWLAEFKEERGDDLVEAASRNERRPEQQVRQLEEARGEYEEAVAMDPTRQESIDPKLEELGEALAEAYEASGDQFTSEAMAMAGQSEPEPTDPRLAEFGIEEEVEEVGAFEGMSEDQLQMAISKMERGIKDYEMAENINPNLESAAQSRTQSLQQLSELRNALNQQRLQNQGEQSPLEEFQLADEQIEDIDTQSEFEDLRDLQVTRSIFRARNYDTERQGVSKDW